MVSSDFLVIQSVHSNPSSLNCEVMRMVNVDDSISFHLPSGWPFGISSKKKKKNERKKRMRTFPHDLKELTQNNPVLEH